MASGKQVSEGSQHGPPHDDRHMPFSSGRSIFPGGAVACIYKPSRSAMTSGKARTKGWHLAFERRVAPFVEPPMGYTGNSDTLPQIQLEFPTLQSAIRYAERQGLCYIVQGAGSRKRARCGPGVFSPARMTN